MRDEVQAQQRYWDELAAEYQSANRIAVEDFHFGPLLPGDKQLKVLPSSVTGWRCLELGCGAGQNSIYLASRGARCVGLDISGQQLALGREQAQARGVDVEFRQGAMEQVLPGESECFDLVHSVLALPFTGQPRDVIQGAARLLRQGGVLVLATIHPLFAFEWLEIEGEGMGGFVGDYFHPPDDMRGFDEADEDDIGSRAWPLSALAEWITEAGLVMTRLLEPRPLHPDEGPSPYTSADWEPLRSQLERIPLAVIFVARKLSLPL
jgi:SAM-dependent methyltransferase